MKHFLLDAHLLKVLLQYRLVHWGAYTCHYSQHFLSAENTADEKKWTDLERIHNSH